MKEIELEKVAVSDIEDLSTVKSLTADDKYSLPNGQFNATNSDGII